MPFQSERQRKWAWANKPEMARRWEREYDYGGLVKRGIQIGVVDNLASARRASAPMGRSSGGETAVEDTGEPEDPESSHGSSIGRSEGSDKPGVRRFTVPSGTVARKIIVVDRDAPAGEKLDQGGYTGDLPPDMPAGTVHGGEFVIPAAAVKALGQGYIDRLEAYIRERTGKRTKNDDAEIEGYASGGSVAVGRANIPKPNAAASGAGSAASKANAGYESGGYVDSQTNQYRPTSPDTFESGGIVDGAEGDAATVGSDDRAPAIILVSMLGDDDGYGIGGIVKRLMPLGSWLYDQVSGSGGRERDAMANDRARTAGLNRGYSSPLGATASKPAASKKNPMAPRPVGGAIGGWIGKGQTAGQKQDAIEGVNADDPFAKKR